MEQYGLLNQKRGPVPPMRVSSLSSSETRTLSSAGRSSEASSMRSGRSALSFDSGHRTSQESTKPRLSKDQQEFLERQFAQLPKPNTQTKKVFANDLNVPLEKINNWFQNRRAKSKQDAKKKNNVYHHYASQNPFANGRTAPDQCYIDPSFYHHSQPLPGYLQNSYQPVLPTNSCNSCEPYVNTNNAHFGVPLDTSADMSQAQPLSEQEMLINDDDPNPKGFDFFFGLSECHDPNALNMYGRQFPGPEPGTGQMDTIPEHDESSPNGNHASHSNGDTASMRQFHLGSEDAPYSIGYPPANGEMPMAPSADFFHPNEAHPDRYPLRTWGQSAGRLLDSDQQHLGLDAGDAQLPYRTLEQTHHVTGVTPASLHGPSAQPHIPSDGSDDFGFKSSESLENAIFSDEPMSDGASPVAKRDHPPLRRVSTMSRLVDSIDHVEVQPHVLERKSSQQSIGHPSLASRRQRRPAPLSASGMRSTSFTSNGPASPKPVQAPSSDKELRRVRSSIGVMNGRVQKAGLAVSAQRSPLSFTFSDGTASSRISKSLSSRSMTSLSVDTLSRTNSLVPITPVSPPDEEPDPNDQANGHKSHASIHENPFDHDDSVWANMPNTSDTTTGSVWSSHVPDSGSSDPFDNYASPPETPLQHQQLVGVSYPGQNGHYSMMSPHAHATATWPHHYPIAGSSHPYPAPLPPAMMGYHPNLLKQVAEQAQMQHGSPHRRQLSRTNSGNALEYGLATNVSAADYPTSFVPAPASDPQQMPTPTQQYQMLPQEQHQQQQQQQQQDHSPQRSQSQSQSHPTPPTTVVASPQRSSPQRLSHQQKSLQSNGQYIFQLREPDLPGMESGQAPPSSAPSDSLPTKASQELLIQQFSPREPVDPSRLPPKNKLNETPKHFEFQTLGPENFSSP